MKTFRVPNVDDSVGAVSLGFGMRTNYLGMLSDRIGNGLGHRWIPFAISFALLCVLIGSQIVAGNVAYEFYSQDVFVVLDGILHLQAGHRMHEDFTSTVGLFYLLPYYLTTFVMGLDGMTIIYGNALAGLFTFALAVMASRGRISAMWGAIFSFYVGFQDISPRLLSLNVSLINYGNQAFYNRFAWGLFSILCLLVAIPRRENRDDFRRDLDSVFCGLLLFILFYLKITYFVAGIGLLGVTLIGGFPLNLRRLGIALTALVGAALLFELGTGITGPYLVDLMHAFQVAHPDRMQDLIDIAIHNYNSTLLVIVIACASAILAGASINILPKLFYVVAALGAGIVLATYNNKAYEIPLVPTVALVAMLSFSPWKEDLHRLQCWRLLLTAVVALTFARPIALDFISLIRAEHRSFVPGSKVSLLQGTPLSDLVVTEKPNRLLSKTSKERPVCCVVNDSEYFYLLSDGMALLKRHIHGNETVLAFAWSNPFPILLGLPPVKHNLLWWDEYRTFSAASSPKPSELLGGVDYIMVPKTDMPWGPAPLMSKIYGDELRAKFQRADESAYWILLARR